ncbi:MAG: hypothetical protein ACFFBS_04320 [Promethearchaeota archaeon]
MGTLLGLEKVEETVRRIRNTSFTILDFIEIFQRLYPKDWGRLLDRFGQFGEKRRYTVNTYLSNRLDIYSHKQGSLLLPLTHYSEGKFKDRRRTTNDEQKHFGSPWITVYKKKK